jgi:hypothetical protein
MDETKGEPIPVPSSIIHSSHNIARDGMDPNIEQVRRQNSQLTMISTLSTSQHHPTQYQDRNTTVASDDDSILNSITAQRHYPNQNPNLDHRANGKSYPPTSMLHQRHSLHGTSSHQESYGRPLPPPHSHPRMQQQFQSPMISSHSHHTVHNIHDEASYQQQPRSFTAGMLPVAKPLKSVVMIDRIPPPIPPLPPHIRGVELNCVSDILSAPISQRCLIQRQQKTKDQMDITAIFVVGTPTSMLLSSDSKNKNGLNSSFRIPYHSYMIECPECRSAMVVSKYCIVVQCPQCRKISPNEATSLSITTAPQTMHHKTSSNMRYIDPRM